MDTPCARVPVGRVERARGVTTREIEIVEAMNESVEFWLPLHGDNPLSNNVASGYTIDANVMPDGAPSFVGGLVVWRQRVSVPGFSLSWWPILAGRRGLWRVDCGISLSEVVLGILLVPYEYLDGEFGGWAGSGLGADWQRHAPCTSGWRTGTSGWGTAA
jgi:hypothetical protein